MYSGCLFRPVIVLSTKDKLDVFVLIAALFEKNTIIGLKYVKSSLIKKYFLMGDFFY